MLVSLAGIGAGEDPPGKDRLLPPIPNCFWTHREVGEFYLLPAVIADGAPELMPELAILKSDISIKDAANVGERDIEAMELRRRGKRTWSAYVIACANTLGESSSSGPITSP